MAERLSPFAMVVMDKAVEVAYSRLYSRPIVHASPQGRIEAEQQMTVYDVLHALDSLLGEFVAGLVAVTPGGTGEGESVHDIAGSIPDFTGELTAVEYVRRMRGDLPEHASPQVTASSNEPTRGASGETDHPEGPDA